MNVFRIGASALFAIALVSLSLAVSPVGKWKGKVGGQMPPLPANATPEQKKQYDSMKEMVAKIVINLEFKGDKTYSVVVTGSPQKAPPETGTWTQSGNTVTVKSTKNGQTRTQPMTMSADGKTITMSPPGGSTAKITFVRS
jgi:hypothetical protein